MNDLFQWRTQGKVTFLSFYPWYTEGFIHGFIGRSLDFSPSGLDTSRRDLLEAVGGTGLHLLRQVHGNCVVRHPVAQELSQGDAFLSHYPSGDYEILGIRTADCLPVILRGKDTIAVIHAGWRGLACAIISHCVQELQKLGEETMEAVIGPAAGPRSYEVGSEVVEALHPYAVAVRSGEGKFLLNLGETARAQLVASGVPANKVYIAPICTIEDLRFHSHRRQGSLRGNNLAFVVI